MTGADHYREAERLAVPSRDIARAQVHATLALTAATAWSHASPGEYGKADTKAGEVE